MATAFQIRRAAHLIQNGGVIVYPTDTIYGLGCDPYNIHSVERIYNIKRRSNSKSMILIASHIEQLANCTDIADQHELLCDTPTTWIIPASSRCPHWLQAEDSTIAVRLTRHPVVKQLCDILKTPLISTSANISGRHPADNSCSIHRMFHHNTDAILIDDAHSSGMPSTIKRYDTDNIIRA